jgi:hypothetical protein
VLYEDYRAVVPALIAAHGGRYLVRGGAVEVLEGDGPALRQVIVEFPDMAVLNHDPSGGLGAPCSAAFKPEILMKPTCSRRI